MGTAAAIPGTLVNLAAGGGERNAVTFGHPSGTLRVGAEAEVTNGQWTATKAIMSRSARILMEGRVRVSQATHSKERRAGFPAPRVRRPHLPIAARSRAAKGNARNGLLVS
ncbi:PrpF domain-containing protein [Microbulbifer sp.]|uniref:PrpF domain-containing protein n=1 Tax=Microbulbifer sp. TaxID=1908541 RepID=UPI003F318B90